MKNENEPKGFEELYKMLKEREAIFQQYQAEQEKMLKKLDELAKAFEKHTKALQEYNARQQSIH